VHVAIELKEAGLLSGTLLIYIIFIRKTTSKEI
jgi:hypothetical protein